ncbi:MAG: dTDP-4-dehydrorhamnose reductase [Thermoanaerobaculia bacterium]
MKPRVLVTGGGGMLARDLKPRLEAAGFEVVAPGKTQLDIAQAGHVSGILATLKPQAVFNCAAFTKVDLCETDPLARAVNDEGVGILADACRDFGSRLVHVSTDFVFDGEKREPYREDDEANPVSAYGKTKRGGEVRALSIPGSLVVRSSWLFGSHGPNFVDAILKQVESGGRELRVVADQVGRPTATSDLADALVELYRAGAEGILHFANAGEVTWNEFAREILRLSGLRDVVVAPISSGELKRPARRPAYSVLSTEKYEGLIGKNPRDFREPLAEYLERRARNRARP